MRKQSLGFGEAQLQSFYKIKERSVLRYVFFIKNNNIVNKKENKRKDS